MYQIKINNCNNIKKGEIKLEPNKLNIKYGINGTGKTTIAKAIKFSNDAAKLQTLKSYYADDDASISISPVFQKILVFDEEFVNQVVFKEDEVIENTFEIFLKTPNYEQKREQLNRHLQSLKEILSADSKIISLRECLLKINEKFKRTATGKLSATGAMKSLLSKQNIYNIPSELKEFDPFFSNNDINISWIDWRNKGDDYDIGDNCPYCSEMYDIPKHIKQKEVFKRTYTKNESKNLKEVLELLENLKVYLKPEKYDTLISYVKNDTPEDVIKSIMVKLTTEFELIISRFNEINEFGQKKIVIADIAGLEQQISNMEFPKAMFEMFGGEIIENIFDEINQRINILKGEAIAIKTEMGELKGIVQATIKTSQNDINEFLKTAGINYELVIQAEDESNSRTILKQCFSDERTEVHNIRQHLSWGEKNAFSLVLFMYYAKAQNPDLIILDDPISSFDNNKKYAILHRMFKNIGKRDVALTGNTVLLLTHDFEPITDFIVVGKLSEEQAVASFVWNAEGNISEKEINPDNDIKLIVSECEDIAKNEEINIVSRIAFLRKLCELNACKGVWDNAYQILSCLIHASDIKRKIGNDTYIDMSKEDISAGFEKIREFIGNFDFGDIKTNIYNVEGIKKLYDIEKNVYLKVQLFRALCEILPDNSAMRMTPLDDGWYKFIDETYHIENDYLHYLDITKFNIVPSYISDKVDTMIAKL